MGVSAPVTGVKVKPEEVAKTLLKCAAGLWTGEMVWFYARCNNMRPTIDRVAVTNARILGIDRITGRVLFALEHAGVTSVRFNAGKGQVTVEGGNPQPMTFKAVHADDVAAVEHYLNYAATHPDAVLAEPKSEPDPSQLATAGADPKAGTAATTSDGAGIDPDASAAAELEQSSAPADGMDKASTVEVPADSPDFTADFADALRGGPWVAGTGVVRDEAEEPLRVVIIKRVEAERVLFVARGRSARPNADYIVVTTARVFSLSRKASVWFMAALSDSTITCDARRGRVHVRTAAGREIRFDSVAAEDLARVAWLAAQPAHVLAGKDADQLWSAAEAAVEADRRRWHPTKEEKRHDNRAQAGRDRERYGALVGKQSFGGASVAFYDKGYVRVGGVLSGSVNYEKLLEVTSSADIQKKSGAGRAVGFAASGGLSMFASNKRGDVWVTLVTDAKARVLHEDPPTAMNMRAAKTLEGLGLAALAAARAKDAAPSGSPASGFPTAGVAPPPHSPPPAPAPDDPAQRLKRVDDLHSAGVISDEEHAAARAKIIAEL